MSDQKHNRRTARAQAVIAALVLSTQVAWAGESARSPAIEAPAVSASAVVRAVAGAAELASALPGWLARLAGESRPDGRLAEMAASPTGVNGNAVDSSIVTSATTVRRIAPPAAGLRPPSPASVFGSVAISFRRLPALDRLQPSYAEMDATNYLDCADKACSAAHREMGRELSNQRDRGFLSKVEAVNRLVNARVAYTRDIDSYGMLDHWATPGQTLERGVGDCEDYAILKMALLAELGVPRASMSVVILNDERRNLFHAVLAVKTNRGFYILDNVHDQLKLDSEIAHYSPLYSVSGGKGFIHGRKARGGDVVSQVRLDSVAPGEGPYVEAAPARGQAF